MGRPLVGLRFLGFRVRVRDRIVGVFTTVSNSHPPMTDGAYNSQCSRGTWNLPSPRSLRWDVLKEEFITGRDRILEFLFYHLNSPP